MRDICYVAVPEITDTVYLNACRQGVTSSAKYIGQVYRSQFGLYVTEVNVDANVCIRYSNYILPILIHSRTHKCIVINSAYTYTYIS